MEQRRVVRVAEVRWRGCGSERSVVQGQRRPSMQAGDGGVVSRRSCVQAANNARGGLVEMNYERRMGGVLGCQPGMYCGETSAVCSGSDVGADGGGCGEYGMAECCEGESGGYCGLRRQYGEFDHRRGVVKVMQRLSPEAVAGFGGSVASPVARYGGARFFFPVLGLRAWMF